MSTLSGVHCTRSEGQRRHGRQCTVLNDSQWLNWRISISKTAKSLKQNFKSCPTVGWDGQSTTKVQKFISPNMMKKSEIWDCWPRIGPIWPLVGLAHERLTPELKTAFLFRPSYWHRPFSARDDRAGAHECRSPVVNSKVRTASALS